MKEAGMMETGGDSSGEAWKKFARRHWKMTLLMAGGIAAAAVAALLVFLWVVADLQDTGLVPSGLGEWTVGFAFTLLLAVIVWELILVVSWVIPMVLAAYFLWYRKLPLEERKEYEGKPGRRRSTGENSGISFFIGLVWLAIVWIDGKWNLAFEDWTFNDWVYSWLAAGLVVLVIAGIPVLIYVIWAIRRNGT
jgi:cation transport ATPase